MEGNDQYAKSQKVTLISYEIFTLLHGMTVDIKRSLDIFRKLHISKPFLDAIQRITNTLQDATKFFYEHGWYSHSVMTAYWNAHMTLPINIPNDYIEFHEALASFKITIETINYACIKQPRRHLRKLPPPMRLPTERLIMLPSPRPRRPNRPIERSKHYREKYRADRLAALTALVSSVAPSEGFKCISGTER